MGYFNALVSSYFKTAQDGGKLFYPWAVWGRGYVLASAADEQRLRQRMKAYYVVAAVTMIAGYVIYNYIGAIVAGAACLIGYAIWSRQLVRGLAPTSEKMTIKEGYAAQARAASAGALWFAVIFLGFLCAVCVAMLIVAPAEWLTAIAGILMFGLTATIYGWMLALRRRQEPTPGHRQSAQPAGSKHPPSVTSEIAP